MLLTVFHVLLLSILRLHKGFDFNTSLLRSGSSKFERDYIFYPIYTTLTDRVRDRWQCQFHEECVLTKEPMWMFHEECVLTKEPMWMFHEECVLTKEPMWVFDVNRVTRCNRRTHT